MLLRSVRDKFMVTLYVYLYLVSRTRARDVVRFEFKATRGGKSIDGSEGRSKPVGNGESFQQDIGDYLSG